MNITYERMDKSEQQSLANMFELYAYDCSSYFVHGLLELNDEGLYLFSKLDAYFSDPAYDLYLIRVDQHLAGFVIVKTTEENSITTIIIEQFFIIKKYSRKGVGKTIAKQIFSQYPGRWRVEQLEKNYPAQAFWRNVIKEYTHNNYVEKYVNRKPVQEFFSGTTPFLLHVNEDITLKLLEIDDAERLFFLIDQSRDYLRRWQSWTDNNQTTEDTKKFILKTREQWFDNTGFVTGIWYKEELAGCIGFHQIDWINRSTSIGYWLGELFQGKGIMIQSCRALVDHAMRELKLNRIEIHVSVGNEKSGAIPKQLDFQREGCTRQAYWLYDHFVDNIIYALLASDWKNR
jgi:ribosomal-protein-serine acetyltransferase